jgi:hypothetical protein
MKGIRAFVVTAAALAASAAVAQEISPGLGEVLVSGNRQNVPYAGGDRPVVGLRRRADAAVMAMYITSDSRDYAVRQQEIYTVLLATLDKAAAAGLEVVTGNTQLNRVTKANYKDLPIVGAGRVDTGKVDLLIKGKLGATAFDTQRQLAGFIGSIRGSGRATVGNGSGISLTISNPDQYRDAIIKLVAVDVAHAASLFGPTVTYNITGIDGQVAWTQVSSTEVFLYIPYRYTLYSR